MHVTEVTAQPNQPSSTHHDSSEWMILPLADATETAVAQKLDSLTQYIRQHPQANIDSIGHTLTAVLPGTAAQRWATLVSTQADINTTLSQLGNTAVQTAHTPPPPIIFMFPGIGDHYLELGKGLYETMPVFRQTLAECDDLCRPYVGESLIDLLYANDAPAPAANPSQGFDLAAMLGRTSTAAPSAAAQRIHETAVAHPLLFSIEYALTRLLQHFGMQPQAMLGYSLGEYVAACISGVLTLADAIKLVGERAQLIQSLPGGSMLAISLPINDVRPHLSEHISLSAHNGEMMTIVAGESEPIQALQQKLTAQQVACRLLDTTHAFHSHMMQPAVQKLTALAKTIKTQPPTIPYVSNVTGKWISPDQTLDPAYWAQHMCQPVRCFDMLKTILADTEPLNMLLEVGPGQSLGSFAKQHPQCLKEQGPLILPTMRYSYEQEPDDAFLLNSLRKVWQLGHGLSWSNLRPTSRGQTIPQLEKQLQQTAVSHTTVQQKERGELRRQSRKQRHRRQIDK